MVAGALPGVGEFCALLELYPLAVEFMIICATNAFDTFSSNLVGRRKRVFLLSARYERKRRPSKNSF